jgi:SpoVK/Ycf46/Vps4 family AAA+-type ATPase
MRREDDLKRVIELISWWVTQVKLNNCIDFFDINRVSEDLALKLLNEIYGYHLENLNYTKANYPGIDLGDKTNKIGFQITSRRDTRKFKESLERFSKGPHEIYSNGIRFFILSQDQKPGLSKKKYARIYPGFDPVNHILTINDLIRGIQSKYETNRVGFNKIKNILEEEIASKYLPIPDYPRMKWFPGLHRLMARIGILPEPQEAVEIRKYLRELHSQIKNDMRDKTYLPLSGKPIPSTSPLENELSKDPFVSPIHQVILQILGQSKGGDSASAQISAVNRRSRVVRNILTLIDHSKDPLILLGDPGSGKTMTLQQSVMTLAKKESRRIFPRVPIYVRLGEFHVEGKKVTLDDVNEYVKQSVPPSIRNRFDELEQAQRLVIFFDGMDEMSRERYNEHTEALSVFAGGTMAKTLFSCRITDFSPAFIHQRLVLLPFNKNQVDEYLDKYIKSFPIEIDGEDWKRSKLAKYIIRGELPIEANNPFVLWLLCLYLQLKETWPISRVELLRFYNEQNYQRKNSEKPEGEPFFPDMSSAFYHWARFAFMIIERNLGPTIPVRLLQEGYDAEEIHEMILTGKKCGVLIESRDKYEEHLVRFEHHRFQEFFAALYIHENKPPIDWLSKLDAPRWQETMLNLILLGEADNAVHTFATTIEEQIGIYQAEISEIERLSEETKRLMEEEEKKKEEKLDGESQPDQYEKKEELKEPELILSYEHEAILADRVELSSRILHQIGSGFQKVRDTIMPIFKKAVGFLADNGNPITQVKMMRACQNVPGIGFIEALQTPLNSTIHWVRNQALILIGSSQAGSRAVGADLPTEIGLDLANGVFPLRLSAYWKAVRSSGNLRYWCSLLMGAFCYLMNFLFLLVASGLLYAWMCSLGNKTKVIGLPGFSILSQPISIGIFAFLVLLAAGITIRIQPTLLWIGILGSVFLIGPLIPVLSDLWIGNWKGFGNLIVDYLLLGFMAVFFVCSLIAVPIHFSMLSLYLALTERLRQGKHSFKTFFIGMFRNCDFDSGLTGGLKGTIVYILLWLVGFWTQKFYDEPIHPLLAFLSSFFYVIIRFFTFWLIIRQFQAYFRSYFAIFSPGIFTKYILDLFYFMDKK